MSKQEYKKPPFRIEESGSLKNKLLLAMPALRDDGLFTRSVIYICAHSEDGAMGIVVNQRLPEISFHDLLSQLGLQPKNLQAEPIVHFGGPVESGRGFVLHTTDFLRTDTVRITEKLGITGTIDILKAMAEGNGPAQSIFALGYAGWGPGQLEAELHANAWLILNADEDLVFDRDLSRKWEKGLQQLGIDPTSLSTFSGRA